MANLRTTADVVDAVLKRCGELVDGTSSYDSGGDVLGYVNSVYRGILAGGNEFSVDCGEPWIWAQATSPQILTLLPAVTTGSMAVTNGSASLTLSATYASSLAGWFFKVDGDSEWYTILTHTAGTAALTIDQSYLGSTAVAASYRIVKLDYALPTAVCRLVAPMRVYKDNVSVSGYPEQGKLFELDPNAFDRKWPRMLLDEGMPENYSIIVHDNTDLITVRFNSYVMTSTRCEIPYIPVQSDLTDSSLSIPVVPFGFREILLHGAAYYLMLDKSDNRADAEAALCKAKIQSLVHHNRKQLSLAGSFYGRLVPRRGNSRRRFGIRVDG